MIVVVEDSSDSGTSDEEKLDPWARQVYQAFAEGVARHLQHSREERSQHYEPDRSKGKGNAKGNNVIGPKGGLIMKGGSDLEEDNGKGGHKGGKHGKGGSDLEKDNGKGGRKDGYDLIRIGGKHGKGGHKGGYDLIRIGGKHSKGGKQGDLEDTMGAMAELNLEEAANEQAKTAPEGEKDEEDTGEEESSKEQAHGDERPWRDEEHEEVEKETDDERPPRDEEHEEAEKETDDERPPREEEHKEALPRPISIRIPQPPAFRKRMNWRNGPYNR